jgi:microcystin degradation protein MlrC
MKNYYLLLAVLVSMFTMQGCSEKTKELPRIAIAGFGIECSTFSPAQTTEDAFRVRRGDKVMSGYSFLSPDSMLYSKAQWFPSVVAGATPGGIVTRETYESLVGQIFSELKKNLPYDGLFLDIHGAMSVVGLDDPEGDFTTRLREVVGNETIISTSMDLHGNVSKKLATNMDLITCYRMAPHEDATLSRRRAAANLIERLETGKGRPGYKAWVNVPILLPGEKTSTRVEPGKTLYAAVAPAADQKGVIDAAIWVSYAWADEPRNHAVVMVVGDDKEVVGETAEDLAKKFWAVRNQFEFIAPTANLDVCLDKAVLPTTKRPFMISDMGDNPTAGGAGDVTWTLTELLKRKEFKTASGPSLIYASIPGAELVEKAIKAGVGNKVEGYAGAKVDSRYAPPVLLKGTVEFIKEDDVNSQVVIKVGSMHVIVTEKRKPFHYEANFTDLGLQPRKTDIVVVKLGYLTTELYNMRGDWMMALTRGGVDQDLLALPYKRINRPMFPFDKDMKDPALKAEFIPFVK